MSFINPAQLEGKVAVITGAGRGIGRAIALAYASAGAAVVCGARSEREIRGTAGAISEAGGRSVAQVVDVGDYGTVSALYQRAADEFGGVDIVVVNAGAAMDGLQVADTDPAQWSHVINVNLTGAYHTAHAAIPWLRKRGGGKMIMIGSGQRKRPAPGRSAYACSKAGLWMLTETLAMELRDDNISVNELIPGPVRTELTRDMNMTSGEWVKEPDEVIPLALFLAGMPDVGPSAQSFSLMRRS